MSQPTPPIDEPTPELGSGTVRRVSLEDVLEAGAQTLLTSLDEADRGALNFETLDRAVSRTGTELAGRPLDDATQGSSDATAAEREGGEGIGAIELEQLVAILETEGEVPDFGVESHARLENASILMHEVHRIGTKEPEAYGRRIDAMLRGVDARNVTDLLLTAALDLATLLTPAAYDVWMRAMVPLLRRAVPFLVQRLSAFAVEQHPIVRETLWPHILDEFLLGLGTRSRELDPRVHALEPAALDRAMERLLTFSALGASRLTPGMYRIDQEFARPVALLLMRSAAHERFGPLLLGAFRESMPYDFGVRSCVLAHKRYTDALGWLLTQQLETPRSALVGDAQRSTAWVLTQGLAELDLDRRAETWVPDAIRWLGERDMRGDANEQRYAARDLFEQVLEERRGLRRIWSKDCRRAATRALANGSLR